MTNSAAWKSLVKSYGSQEAVENSGIGAYLLNGDPILSEEAIALAYNIRAGVIN